MLGCSDAGIQQLGPSVSREIASLAHSSFAASEALLLGSWHRASHHCCSCWRIMWYRFHSHCWCCSTPALVGPLLPLLVYLLRTR